MKFWQILFLVLFIILAIFNHGNSQGIAPRQLKYAPAKWYFLVSTNPDGQFEQLLVNDFLADSLGIASGYWALSNDTTYNSTSGVVLIDSILDTESIRFQLTPTITESQGVMYWDADEETVSLVQNGAILQIGQEVQVHCRNSTGVQINDGTVVMATGTVGASGRITIEPYDGTTDIKYVLGIATEDIPAGQDGKVTAFGKVRGINTNSWNDGDVLYATTGGALTNVVPTSGIKNPLAFVIHKAVNGIIMVRFTPIDEQYLANQTFTRSNDTIFLQDSYGNYIDTVDLKSYLDNTDDQAISIDSTGRVFTITLEDGGTVKFRDTVDDADASATNEIQTLSIDSTGRVFTITASSGGGSVKFLDQTGSGYWTYDGTYGTQYPLLATDKVLIGSTSAALYGNQELNVVGDFSLIGESVYKTGSSTWGLPDANDLHSSDGINDWWYAPDMNLVGSTLKFQLQGVGVGTGVTIDPSSTNEAWTIDGDGGDTEQISNQTVLFAGSGIASTSYSAAANTLTITATEVDGSTTNELQTVTGEVTATGTTTLTTSLNKTAITNKTLVTAASGDHVLIADATDSDNLKKVNVSDFLSAATPTLDQVTSAGNTTTNQITTADHTITDTNPFLNFNNTGTADDWIIGTNGTAWDGFYLYPSTSAGSYFNIVENSASAYRLRYYPDGGELLLYDGAITNDTMVHIKPVSGNYASIGIDSVGTLDYGAAGEVLKIRHYGTSLVYQNPAPFTRLYLGEDQNITITAAIINIDDATVDSDNYFGVSGGIELTAIDWHELNATLELEETSGAATTVDIWLDLGGAQPSNSRKYTIDLTSNENTTFTLNDIFYNNSSNQQVSIKAQETGGTGTVAVKQYSTMTIKIL